MAIEEKIKCLVFDLDGTLWRGVLSEGGANELEPCAAELIKELDERGVIMSIASKNDESAALARLGRFGIGEYFLCPRISWAPKSESIKAIADELGIKLGSIAFIDDNEFERDEVSFKLPDVRVYDASELGTLAEKPEFNPVFITEDAKHRREMYIADIGRKKAEESYSGSADEFLATLGMHLTLSPVTEEDLKRVYELTVRTHQLNSTGYTYDYDELRALIGSEDHIFLIASLTDRYGDSGKVGLLLIEKGEKYRIKLLIVSCRVMSRGIGTALLTCAIKRAVSDGKGLVAEFRETEHNRIMYITYKLSGFDEISELGEELLLEYAEDGAPDFAEYLDVELTEGAGGQKV